MISNTKPSSWIIMRKIFNGILLIFLVISVNYLKSQSLPGTTGYFNIPSADLQPDKSVYFGFNQATKKYQDYGNGEYDINIFYGTITFLEFLEVGLRYSRLDGFEPPDRKQAGDRIATARIRPIKQGKYHPSVLIGFQNFFTTLESGNASHFNSTYIVLTKDIGFQKIFKNIGLSIGYGSDFINSADYQFIGLFGGIQVIPQHLDFLEIMFEYDADKWNVGTRLTLFNHLKILTGFEGLDSFSGGIAYQFTLP